MRRIIKEVIAPEIAKLTQLKPGSSVLEIGSFCVPAQKQFANLRPLFPGFRYLGVDQVEGLGVDQVADAHNLSFPDHSFDLVLLFDVLEHVAAPDRVLGQVLRVLKRPGWVFLSSHQNFAVHYPPDYWRFTPQGLAFLLRRFERHYVYAQGNEAAEQENSPLVFGVGTTHPWPMAEHFDPVVQEHGMHRIETPPIPEADRMRAQR